MFYTIAKGSIRMPNGRLASCGDRLKPEDFKGYEKNLQTLLREGNLVQGAAQVSELDVDRGQELPPIPERIDGKRPITSKTRNTEATKRKVEAIAAAQAERAGKLAEFEGEELTVAEAKAHGLVK
jgi:hypothetical protein